MEVKPLETSRVAVWLWSAYHAGMMKERKFPPPAPELIRQLRTKRGQTQTVFGDEFGVRTMTVQHWESNQAKPQGLNRVMLWRAIKAEGIAPYPDEDNA